MDATIKNISQLEEALAKMKRPSQVSTTLTSASNSPMLTPQHTGTATVKEESPSVQSFSLQAEQASYKPLSRSSTAQGSTSGLLLNLAGLQTTTNLKVDKLTDAIFSLQNCMERIHAEQSRQTELLATIARNTVALSSVTSNPGIQKSNGNKINDVSIKEYGFNTNAQLLTEFIMSLLKQIKLQAVNKDRSYRITRDLKKEDLSRAIDIAAKNKFKINGVIHDEIEMKGLKITSFVKVASKIGSINGTKPMLTPETFREIFDDPECALFGTCIERLLIRLSRLRVLLPCYDGDIISAIEHPYFTKNGDAICTWSEVNPRSESIIETKAASASIKDREKIAKLLAMGIKDNTAVRNVIRDT